MPFTTIVSYDGTTHDDDALMLGRMLSSAGASLALAYVRHSREYDPRREEIGVHDANRRLEQGADWLAIDGVPQHVVVNPSTGEGLAGLAAAEGAALVVFGSDYRTPPGHVEPGAAAQGLLNSGTVAVAVAAAGLRAEPVKIISTVAVSSGDASGAAAQTAQSLVSATGAQLVDGFDADIILVDSTPSATPGRVALDGATRGHLDSARGSVIVLPQGVALSF